MSEIPPQQPSSPPAGARPSGTGGQGPATVDLGVLSLAWPMVQKELATWAIATLLVNVIIFAIAMVFNIVIFGGLMVAAQASGAIIMVLFAGALMVTVMIAACYLLTAGLYGMALKQLKGEPIAVGDLFSFKDQAPQIILGAFIVGISTGIASAFCYFPAFLVGGLMMFTIPIILDKKLAAVDAVKLSIETLKPQMWMAALAFFVFSVVAGLGTIVCGVGVLVTIPIMIVSVCCLYRNFFWTQAG